MTSDAVGSDCRVVVPTAGNLLARADALIAHVGSGRDLHGWMVQLEALVLCVVANCPVMLWCEPGIDKQAVMRQLARALDVPLEVVSGNLSDGPHGAVSPIRGSNGSGSVPLADWASRFIQTQQGLLLLDEVTLAAPAARSAMLRIASERRVRGFVLPSGFRIVAAIDRSHIATRGWYPGSRLAAEFVHLDWSFEPEVLAGCWSWVNLPQIRSPHPATAAAWARAVVSGFLTTEPPSTHRVPRDAAVRGHARPSLRTWEIARRLLTFVFATTASRDAVAAALTGAVGAVAGARLLEYADSLGLADLTRHSAESELSGPSPATAGGGGMVPPGRAAPSGGIPIAVARSGPDVRVLGPVEVIGPAGPGRLPGAIPRALLGLLALRVGREVAVSYLIDALWGDQPPRTAKRTLHSHICRLRRALSACGLPDALVTLEFGYLLALEPDTVDAIRFADAARRVQDERADDWTGSNVDLLESTLSLWRGDPLEGCDVGGWADGDITRLSELRVNMIETLWERRVSAGGHHGAIPELERLVTVFPLRERLWELLIMALDLDGRRADALAAYQRVRRILIEDLGIEPGPALRKCHSAILTDR